MTTVLIIIIVFLLIMWLGHSENLKKKIKNLEKLHNSEKDELRTQLNQCNTRVTLLSKYEGILDAEKRA